MNTKWASLPRDILVEKILNKLVSVYDYIHSSLVCKSWHSFALQNKHQWHKITSKFPQQPMLIAPSKDGVQGKQSLYDFTTNKIRKFDLKIGYNKRCCGSSHGWLFMVEKTIEITLMNPFSGRVIRLPPLTRDLPYEISDDNGPFNYPCHIFKAILTKDPSIYPNDYMVIAIYGFIRRLAIIKVNNNTWTYPNVGELFEDVNVHNEVIYVLDAFMRLWKVHEHNSTFILNMITPRLEPSSLDPVYNMVYVVESSRGDLLLVCRFFKKVVNQSMNIIKTVDFKVYKLTNICEDRMRRHVEVKNLDNDAMFIGDNHSMCVSTKDFPKCLPNRIYYTDNFFIFDIAEEREPRDVGIFNVKDGSFGTHYITNPAHKNLPPPIWIIPTML